VGAALPVAARILEWEERVAQVLASDLVSDPVSDPVSDLASDLASDLVSDLVSDLGMGTADMCRRQATLAASLTTTSDMTARRSGQS